MSTTIDGTTGVTAPSGGLINPSTDVSGINYSCRAWVNFNGTGTVAIRASGNVTSITDNGNGNYTVNFTTALSDANYNATCMGSTDSTTTGSMPCVWTVNSTQTTSAFQVRTGIPSIPGIVSQNLTDLVNINVSVFR